MKILRRFTNWIRVYPGPQGAHIALLALLSTDRVIEIRKDDDGSVWIGWRDEDRGQWVRLK